MKRSSPQAISFHGQLIVELSKKLQVVEETVENLIAADHRNTEEQSRLLTRIHKLQDQSELLTNIDKFSTENRRILVEAAKISRNFDAWLKKHDVQINKVRDRLGKHDDEIAGCVLRLNSIATVFADVCETLGAVSSRE